MTDKVEFHITSLAWYEVAQWFLQFKVLLIDITILNHSFIFVRTIVRGIIDYWFNVQGILRWKLCHIEKKSFGNILKPIRNQTNHKLLNTYSLEYSSLFITVRPELQKYAHDGFCYSIITTGACYTVVAYSDQKSINLLKLKVILM